MKKILFIAAMLIGAASYGQTPTPALRMANDTIVNAVTTYAYFGTVSSLGAITGDVGSLGTIFTVTKVSGTVAATVTPQVSDDGVHWIDLAGQTPISLTDIALQTGRFAIGAALDKFYRLKIVPTGTQRAALQGNFSVRGN